MSVYSVSGWKWDRKKIEITSENYKLYLLLSELWEYTLSVTAKFNCEEKAKNDTVLSTIFIQSGYNVQVAE